MEIRKMNILGDHYEFINETWETYNSWGHKSILFKNGAEIGSNRVRYINRTWEYYRYQACMMGLVNDLEAERMEMLKDKFRSERNISRITKKYNDEFVAYIKDDKQLKALTKMNKKLKERWN